MELLFIRHGKTKGNIERRYIGRTDEPLAPEGIRALLEARGRIVLEAGRIGDIALEEMMRRTPGEAPGRSAAFGGGAVFVSPMARCRQSADVLFPACTPIVVEGFREYDFGRFEGRTHEEIEDDPEYARWLESGGRLPFPAGEGMEAFRLRVEAAFEETIRYLKKRSDVHTAAYVVHGGTIMSVLSTVADEGKRFYDYPADNGGGYRAVWDGRFPCRLTQIRAL